MLTDISSSLRRLRRGTGTGGGHDSAVVVLLVMIRTRHVVGLSVTAHW